MTDERKLGRELLMLRSTPTSSLVPRPASFRSSLVLAWSVTAIVALGFASLIVIAPLAREAGHNFTALVIYKSFEKFCHQIPERSFSLDGHPFAVCARCTGIYFGFAAGALIYPVIRSLKESQKLPRKWLIIAAAPLLADVALDYLGVWTNTHISRALTGGLLGFVSALFVVSALLDMILMRSHGPAAAGFVHTSEGFLADEQ